MSDSVHNTKRVEIRLPRPATRVRYEKGRAVREAGPDMDRVLAAVRGPITEELQRRFGAVEVEVVLAQSADIRLTGSFGQKPAEVRAAVGEVLETVFEGLEL